MIMWPVEETGRNSVRPSTMPHTKATKQGRRIRSWCRSLGYGVWIKSTPRTGQAANDGGKIARATSEYGDFSALFRPGRALADQPGGAACRMLSKP